MKYLALYLAAPLQSWGGDCKFTLRSTKSYPTRSAITGMLCAALGIERGDKQAIDELRSLTMETLILRPGIRQRDFHTVGGGPELYHPDVRAYCMIHKADGKLPKPGEGIVVTERWYLGDAQFGILITGPPDLLDRCNEALHNPVWGIWLGRKCCIPTAPVNQGLWDSYDAAIKHLCGRSGMSSGIQRICEVEEGGTIVRDVPECFETRTLRSRRVKQTLLEISED